MLTPSGMVLGLRIDGAEEKFAELLEEERVPLSPGDVIVLYTDGITEAMNPNSDLFGESRLSRIVEEHGHLDITHSTHRFRVGEILTVIPNHVCTCVNMHDEVFLLRREEVVGCWRVAARGKIR